MKKLYSLATLFVACLFFSCTLVSYAQSPQCTDFTYQGENYSVGRMGGRCWMKTNLKATRYSDSVVVPFARPYLGNQGDAATYGLLYDWASAARQTTPAVNGVRVQGVCPAGWVLPIAADYTMLNDSVGTEGLVSATGWFEGYGTSTATGFNALPTGYCTDAGRYVDRGLKAYFWTSDATVATATACGFSFDCPTMLSEEKARNYGFSVRCILDSALAVLSITSNPASDTVGLCGESFVEVTYTATVTGATPTTYAWMVNGTDSTAVMGNTLTVRYTSASNNTVTCTAAGVNDTVSTTVVSSAVATMTLCEDYATPSVTISTNCEQSSLVWKNSGSETVLTGSITLSDVPNGRYTVTGTTTSGCSVTKSVYLGNTNQVGCSGAPRDTNEIATDGLITQVKDHQNNSYDVISIGGLCIMKQNLRCTTSPAGHTLSSWESSTTKSCYIQNTTFVNEGFLYNWRAALDTTIDVSTIGNDVDIPNRRGLCPQGWHLPTRSEWTSIVGCHNAGQFAAPNISFTGTGWGSYSHENVPGNTSDPDKNATGFSGVPVGIRYGNEFNDVGFDTYFWCATSDNSSMAYTRILTASKSDFEDLSYSNSNGRSIRCVRDNGLQVTTDSVSSITDKSATCYGTVVDDGGKSVTARGVCWSTTENPTINDSYTSDGSGVGSFNSNIERLNSETTYYVRAYATNSDGTVYGIQMEFKTDVSECLAAGTRITMADGSYKNVENIVVGDLVRTFNHETGEISSAEICMAWKSDTTKQTLNLTFASGKTVGIVGKHDFLFENTRKYVRINKDNVAEYVGKRFYNAESGSWDALVSYEMGTAVNYYCPYTTKHLNCIAEGMLSCPDDVDYILNIYELDANLKADAAQLAADIAQYGLCNVANDFPEFVQYKGQMDNLGAPYLYIAIGKGLVPRSIIDNIRNYWTGQ